jgi:Domain of unknown function (DUF4349)
MSSSDLLEQIRASRPAAPPALRERVRALAATEQPARPSLFARFRPRRLALVALPVTVLLAVVSAGAVGLVRSGDEAVQPEELTAIGAQQDSAAPSEERAQRGAAPGAALQAVPKAVPAPTPGRLERYQASLRLRVENTDALSDATQRAVRLTRELGGYVVTLQSSVPEQGTGGAEIVVRVPRLRVQQAIAGFMELGTILAQNVQVEDLQRQVDEQTDRIAVLTAEIARIERQLRNPDLPLETRSRLSARLAADRRELRELRDVRAQTTREGQLATVTLALTTEEQAGAPAGKSRLDRAVEQAGEVLSWEAAAVLLALVAVGPVLVLALLVWLGLRMVRRRAEERLLERA